MQVKCSKGNSNPAHHPRLQTFVPNTTLPRRRPHTHTHTHTHTLPALGPLCLSAPPQLPRTILLRSSLFLSYPPPSSSPWPNRLVCCCPCPGHRGRTKHNNFSITALSYPVHATDPCPRYPSSHIHRNTPSNLNGIGSSSSITQTGILPALDTLDLNSSPHFALPKKDNVRVQARWIPSRAPPLRISKRWRKSSTFYTSWIYNGV